MKPDLMALVAKFTNDPESVQIVNLEDYHELLRVLANLNYPQAVHVNMLRGSIAKPSFEAFLHLYGEDYVSRWHRANATLWVYEATVYEESGKKHRAVGVVRGSNEDAAREDVASRVKQAFPNHVGGVIVLNREIDAPILIMDGHAVTVLKED